MEHKDVPVAHVKAGQEGRFSALAAVWDVVDRVGDAMRAGAFTETLRRWRESGKRIPIVWSHKTDSPETVIGSADPNDVRETTSGLLVNGALDIDDSPTAKRVWQLLKSGAVSGWSFGYLTNRERRGDDGVNNVLEVELLELGPTVSPANPATATIGVKGLTDVPELAGSVAGKSAAELRSEFDELIGRKETGPIHVATFEA